MKSNGCDGLITNELALHGRGALFDRSLLMTIDWH